MLPGERRKSILTFALHDPALTVPELLRRRGVRTLAVVDNGGGEVLSAQNFSRGFDQYSETDSLPPERRTDAGTVDLALEALDQIPATQPFFMWLHLFGVHAPSTEHPELGSAGSNESERYDHEVRFVDREIGRFLAQFGSRQRPLQTTVILCGDHGERFTNSGTRQHGYELEPTDIRVPMLIVGPGFEPGLVRTPASTADLAPTILALTETPAAEGLDGRDLRSLPENEHRIVMSDTWRYPDATLRSIDLTAALDAEFEVLRDLRTSDTWVIEQASGRKLPSGTRNPAIDRLTLALDTYLEQTGATPPEPIAGSPL
jgi:hypothetical protein